MASIRRCQPWSSQCRQWLLVMVLLLLNQGSSLGTARTAHKAAITSARSKTTVTPPTNQPDRVMTDHILPGAVVLWCTDYTLATQYFGPIAEWDTSQVTNFRALFRRQTTFNDDVSQWDTSKVTSMAAMFEEAHAFDGDLSGWDTSNVVSMSAMFADATSFTGTQNGNSMTSWNVEKVARMDRMFQNAILFQGNLSGWKTRELHHVANMFHNAINYVGNQDLSLWDTSQFRDMSAMFSHAIRFHGNVSAWQLGEALEMDELFSNAVSFQGDLSHWDTSKVITMARMFRNATVFTGVVGARGIHQWNVASVRNFYGMFEDTPAFDADVSRWAVSQAHTMERMFYNAKAFGQTLPSTISAPVDNQLLCWELPNGQVKTHDMFCGSQVRFDPCCVSVYQRQDSCCNQQCDTAVCEHPEQDRGSVQANQYETQTGHLYHETEEDGYQPVEPSGHMRANFPVEEATQEEDTSIGWEGTVMIIVLIVAVVLCFYGLVWCL